MATQTTFRIKRFDPDTKKDWFQSYTIDITPGLTVLEALWFIVRHVDGSLSFRYSCRGAVCGSCAMVINREITLACHTQVLALESDTIEIEPLPRMRVIKDLIVDIEAFLEKYRTIDPFLINTQPHERELLQSPENRAPINDSVKCILCTSCHAACPLTAVDDTYLGPAVLNAAQRFAFDDRNEGGDKVLKKVNDLEGALGCRTVSRCTEVCPKQVDPSIRIKDIKERIRTYADQGKLTPPKKETS
jgi:succinate dehydrogenase / fumarate reductase, iron-sulfur subunit